jgi:hypothetical protein
MVYIIVIDLLWNFTISVRLYKCNDISVDEDILMKFEEASHKFSVLMLI